VQSLKLYKRRRSCGYDVTHFISLCVIKTWLTNAKMISIWLAFAYYVYVLKSCSHIFLCVTPKMLKCKWQNMSVFVGENDPKSTKLRSKKLVKLDVLFIKSWNPVNMEGGSLFFDSEDNTQGKQNHFLLKMSSSHDYTANWKCHLNSLM